MEELAESIKTQILEIMPFKKQGHKRELAQQHWHEALLAYIQWSDRFVRPAQREVIFHENFAAHSSFVNLSLNILKLSKKIEMGDDLFPHISGQAETHAYHPQNGMRWNKDRDFLLHHLGVHHLHLSEKCIKTGAHGDDLVFVIFGRTQAYFVMLGDHKYFKNPKPELTERVLQFQFLNGFELKGILPASPNDNSDHYDLAQRTRHGICSTGVIDNKVVMLPGIATSGHALDHVNHANRIRECLKWLSNKKSEKKPYASIFEEIQKPYPIDADFSVCMHYCDLILYDKKTNKGVLILPWKR